MFPSLRLNPQTLTQSAVSQLQIEKVTNEIGKFAKKLEEMLFHHVNVEAIQLLDNIELVRRLEKKKTF